MTSDIWLGDLAVALRRLGPAAEGRERQIAAALGLTARTAAAGAEPAAVTPPAREPAPQSADEQLSDPRPPERRTGSPTPPTGPAPPLLIPLADSGAVPYIFEGAPLDDVQPRHLRPVVPFVPLLAPRTADVILRTAVRRWVPEGTVDLARLVRSVARNSPVRTVPRRLVPTLRFGTEVLVDLGQGMEPFTRDRGELLRRLAIIVGAGSLAVRYFRNVPGRGVGRSPARTDAVYRPTPRSRILVLSDLGLAGPVGDPHRATATEWTAFAGLAASAAAEVTVLLPVPADRWPGWSRRLFPLICWDRPTDAVQAATRTKPR